MLVERQLRHSKEATTSRVYYTGVSKGICVAFTGLFLLMSYFSTQPDGVMAAFLATSLLFAVVIIQTELTLRLLQVGDGFRTALKDAFKSKK